MKPSLAVIPAVLLTGVLAAGATGGRTPGFRQSTKPRQTAAKGTEQSATHEIHGTIRSMKGYRLTVETRDKKLVQVDAEPAVRAHRSVSLVVNHAIDAVGTTDKAGVLHADTIQHAKPSPSIWPPDR
jgi:hypothetical protein